VLVRRGRGSRGPDVHVGGAGVPPCAEAEVAAVPLRRAARGLRLTPMPRRTVADRVADPRHAGALGGAALAGEARGSPLLVVRVGLWVGRDGRVTRARYRASTCASLIAYAEAACELVEAGEDPGSVDARLLRAAVAGVHAVHHDRADLVALALSRALARPPVTGANP
jgi:hypothetical protein